MDKEFKDLVLFLSYW